MQQQKKKQVQENDADGWRNSSREDEQMQTADIYYTTL